MNHKYKIIFITVGIVASTLSYSVYNTSSLVQEQLTQEKISNGELKNTIKLLNDENLTLSLKLKTQATEITELQVAIIPEAIITQDTNLTEKIPRDDANESRASVLHDNKEFDITEPFNDVDPISSEQQQKFSEFKSDIESYQFNERFDMQGFLNDPRFVNLHASLGVKLLDYVDTQLHDIVLMQDSAEGAKMLIEIEH